MLTCILMSLFCVVTLGSHENTHRSWSSSSSSKTRRICQKTSYLLRKSHPVTPLDYDYDEAREQFAYHQGSTEQRDEKIDPDIIVFPKCDKDIQDILRFARECNYAVAIRSGGHQYSGLSSCNAELGNCLQIDMRHFDKYELNYEDEYDSDYITSITAGVGNRLELITELNRENHVFIPAGVCKQVGLGGHYQSSGIGLTARSFGYGLDYVEQFRIILSDGTIKDVTYENDPKLYWAVLGGNPGSWGVITEYKINVLHDEDYPHSFGWNFVWLYNSDTFNEITKALLNLNQNELFSNYRDFNWYLAIVPTENFEAHIISLLCIWTGIDNGDISDEDVHDAYQVFYERFNSIGIHFTAEYYDISVLHNELTFDLPIPPFKYYVHSDWTDKPLNESWVDLMADELDAIISHNGFKVVFQLINLGGQAAEPNPKNSYPWRSAITGVDNWILFEHDSAAPLAYEMINELRESTRGYWNNAGHSGGIKLLFATDGSENDIDEEWLYYYPSWKHYRKLQRVKERVDPINLFRNSLTIPLPKHVTIEYDEESHY